MKAARGGYAAQVGAFRQKSQARTHLAMINRRYGSILSDGTAEIGGLERGFYRVRFTGMTQDEARDACKALRTRSQPCIVTPN
ncbi:Sporulation related domain protein [compost metagenome]